MRQTKDTTRCARRRLLTTWVGLLALWLLPALAVAQGITTIRIQDGTATGQANVTGSGSLQVDNSGVTQPVSGTLTCNAGSGTFTVGDGAGPLTVDGTTFDGIVKDGAGDTTQANVSGGRLHTDTTGTVTCNLAAGINNIGDVDILSFPDNEPFNVAQINGVTPLMGNGASGTGAQRVTLANDSTGILASVGSITTAVTPGTAAGNLGKAEDAVAGTGDTGIAVWMVREDTPSTTSTASASGDYIAPKANAHGHQFVAALCNDATLTTSVAISSTALNGNAELVALTSNQTIYLCGFSWMVSATANVRLVYGTGTACATGETAITGAYPMVANQGIAVGSAGAIVAKGAVSNAVCIETSAAADVRGLLTYAKGQF
jgi:hypothetical protein